MSATGGEGQKGGFLTIEAAAQAYQDSETENVRLRATLEWLAGRMYVLAANTHSKQFLKVVAELGKRLEDPATHVVDEHAEGFTYAEEVERAKLVQRAREHMRVMVPHTRPKGKTLEDWCDAADILIAELEPYGDEPRKPVVLTARELARRAAKASAHKGRR